MQLCHAVQLFQSVAINSGEFFCACRCSLNFLNSRAGFQPVQNSSALNILTIRRPPQLPRNYDNYASPLVASFPVNPLPSLPGWFVFRAVTPLSFSLSLAATRKNVSLPFPFFSFSPPSLLSLFFSVAGGITPDISDDVGAIGAPRTDCIMQKNMRPLNE